MFFLWLAINGYSLQFINKSELKGTQFAAILITTIQRTFHFKTNHSINDVITCPPTLFTFLSPVQRI